MIGPWLGQALTARARNTHYDVLLPTRAGAPLPSPETLAGCDYAASSYERWRVPTLAPRDPSIFLRRLARLPQSSGLLLGASARYWLTVTHFVDDLIARGCFAPYAGDLDNTLLARWSPLYDARASERLRALAAAMPGTCRALISPDIEIAAPRAPEAQPVLTSFVEHVLDRRVRRPLRRTLGPLLDDADQSIATRWMRRLIGRPRAAILIPRTLEERDFAESLRTWLTPFHIMPQAQGRLCIELSPPSSAEIAPDTSDDMPQEAETTVTDGDINGPWWLSFFLQDVDEPSVLIPVRQIWRDHSRDAAIAQRRFIDAHRTLLDDLARAASLCPPIAESLRDAAPERVALTAQQAHDFLNTHASALEAAGLGVRLPVWWKKQQKLKIEITLSDRAAFFGLDTLVSYNWQAALGDVVLTRAEFETLARLKAPLAMVRGQWVEVNADNIRRALRYFERRKKGLPLGEVLHAGASDSEEDIGVTIDAINASGQTKALIERLRGTRTIAPMTTPEGFTGKLRPYQQRGLSWMAFLSEHGLGACLADDMGLGKTVQLLALIQLWLQADKTSARTKRAEPVLLICPMSIIGNWQREAARFAPALRVVLHHGPERENDAAFAKTARTHDLVLTTYALAHRDRETLRGVKWRAIVLDEAQNIKNSGNKQTRAIKSIETKQRIALTGTPVENGLNELWSIFDFLNPGYLGGLERFARRYSRPIETGNADRAAELRHVVQPFLLRRVKSDKSIIADLPDKSERTVYCNLTREQATLYQAVTKRMLDQIADAERFERGRLIVMALTRLKQICNHPAHYLHDHSRLTGRSGKLARLEDMLEEALSAGDKALVFSQYTEMAGPLARHLQHKFKRDVLYLHGGVGQRKRDELVWRFQEEPNGPPIFVLSLKAGGTGLNLTAANHVFHYDRWWNPAVENQATDRAYRIGQTRNVQVHKLVCLGTLEERIDQLLKNKRALAERVIGDGETWLTTLSTDQLRELFVLGAEAVAE